MEEYILQKRSEVWVHEQPSIMKDGGSGLAWSAGRDREEESLVLFKDLHKREKDLLQPISDEFEPHGGNHALYRISSGTKGSGYHELLSENGKNDYDWLKTPPATPLFPSLEMEPNATQLVGQPEIPILQPLSRFAGNIGASKGRSTVTSKSPNSRPNVLGQRLSIPGNKNPKVNKKTPQLSADPNKRTRVSANAAKLTNQKEVQPIISAKNIAFLDQKAKPASRGVSPTVRSGVPAQIPGFSSDTLPNLRTDRPTSATRPVPSSMLQRSEFTQRSRSVTRSQKEGERILTTQKGKVQQRNNNGNQIFGSRIVEKVLNARKLGADEREAKPKLSVTALNNGITDGYGRVVSKSSVDIAPKNMETRGDRINPRTIQFVPGRSSLQQY